MSMSKKRADSLVIPAYKRASGRSTTPSQDYKSGGTNNVSLDGANAGTKSVARQKSIESAQAERQVENKKNNKLRIARDKLTKKAREKREDANDPTLKQYPDLQRKR